MSEAEKETKSMLCVGSGPSVSRSEPDIPGWVPTGRQAPDRSVAEGTVIMSRIVIAALAGMSLVFVQWIGGAVEGRLFPVMGPLTISDPVPYPPPSYRARWQGQAEKRRNCEFIRMEWYLGPRHGGRVRVSSEFLDRPEVRGEGRLSWDGIVISLPAGEVLINSHADVIHQCRFRPWQTRTRFFDSTG